MHATRTKAVAIYARSASTGDETQRQIHQARALIARQFGDAVDVLVFTDGTSGASIDNRPGLIAMMQAAESGRIRHVVATDPSRIARSSTDLATIADRLCHWSIPLTTTES